MEKLNLGLQSHAVREAFAEDPVKAIERVAAMGYEGMELNMGALNHEPQFYADTFDRFGIKCFSALCGMTQSTLNNVVSGRNNSATVATVKKICDGLEISVPDFFNCPLFEDLEQEIR